MTPRRWTCVFLMCALVAAAVGIGAADQARAIPTGEWQATVARQRLTLTIERDANAL